MSEKKKKRSKSKASKATTTSQVNTVIKLFSNEKVVRILGLSFLLISVYLFVAFISYLSTWQTDQDKVLLMGFLDIFGNGILVDNHLGRLGAYTSHVFFYRGFGLASFVFPVLTALAGICFIYRKLPKIVLRASSYMFMGLVWTSTLLGLVFAASSFSWGGEIGIGTAFWLKGMLGGIGAGAFLTFAATAFTFAVFNVKLPSFKKDLTEEAYSDPNGFDLVEERMASKLDPENQDLAATNIQPEQNEDTLAIDFSSESGMAEEIELEVKEEEAVDPNTAVSEPTLNSSEEEEIELAIEEVIEEQTVATPNTNYDPTLDLGSYKYPPLDILEAYDAEKVQIDKEELERNKDQIINTLQNYKIEISKIKATIGPTVTLYEIVPAAGVRISKIKNLEDDIALSLAALGIRIIAPIPGKGTIGIEVPNVKKEIVSMKTVLSSEKFQNAKMDLPIALGKNIANEIFVTDLAKMPHLLMAGATGQGKSVGLNAIIASLLYKKHPSQLKFVMIDPKKVELALFSVIEKHFLAKLPDEESAIITDTKNVVRTLNSLCIEMDQRYNLLKEASTRNISEYNKKFLARKLNPEKGHRFMPFIVLVIDEFADLMMTAGKEVEQPIARLAQLARAIGIHLIIATQRPSVNIITGTIKANFPARIAFRVSSKVDSRTILDTGGSEQLIGRGDMLISNGNDLVRIQCAFIDTPEVEKLVEFIGDQRGYPSAYILPEVIEEAEGSTNSGYDANDRDSMFEDAARIVVQHQQGSTSLIQRRLKLGYNRAGRIIDQLEAAGIVGKHEGSKARSVLVQDEHELERFLQEINE